MLEQFIPIEYGNMHCVCKEREWHELSLATPVAVCVSGVACAVGSAHLIFHGEASVYERISNESMLI